MKIVSLSIETQASYQPNAGQLLGKVTLEGPTGAQTIVLSSSALSRIFKVVGADIVESTRLNALMVKSAVNEAVAAPLLGEAAKVLLEGVPFQ